jgi:hypothetical protein
MSITSDLEDLLGVHFAKQCILADAVVRGSSQQVGMHDLSISSCVCVVHRPYIEPLVRQICAMVHSCRSSRG